MTGNILARPDDDGCAFGAEVLTAEAESAQRRHGFNAVVLRPPVVVDSVTLDVSALVRPVLDADACAVDTRVQLVIGGDGVLLAAEHFNLLTWTATGLLRRVSESVSRDIGTIPGELRSVEGWWTLTAAGLRSCPACGPLRGRWPPRRGSGLDCQPDCQPFLVERARF